VCRQERARLGTMPFVHNSNRPTCDGHHSGWSASGLEWQDGLNKTAQSQARLPGHEG
jgi:hypothetical protein